MKIAIVTGIEDEYNSISHMFAAKQSKWIYRHEQLKHIMNVDFVVFIPSTKQMADFNVILETILNKGFPIIDMIGDQRR